MELGLKDIETALKRCREAIHPSPLIRSSHLTRLLGSEILLKLENLQETGSFKVRGAYNRLLELRPEEKERGVVAASAGNHAQGVAWACSRLGIPSTIVMPEEVSIRKLMAVKEYGPEIILFGTYFDDAYEHAMGISEATGKTFIAPFDDPWVIAGQGIIGIELAAVLNEETAIIVPIGGGGLISGIALAVKGLNPRVKVIGVQADACPSAIRSLEKNEPFSVEIGPTIADGIAVKRPGALTFPIIQRCVDEVVSVDEETIAGAILTLLEGVNIIAEGAASTTLAALMDKKVTTEANRYILIISGGNIEANMIDRILQRGSIKMGRLIRLQVNLMDAPGALSRLLEIIAREKANILHIFHDRLALDNPIQVSRVELNLETRGPDHARKIFQGLKDAGYEFRQIL